MAIGSIGDGPTSPVPSGPSSLLERMVEELGGWGVVHARPELLASPEAPVEVAGALVPGVVVAGRYELGEALPAPAQGFYHAQDRHTRQPVLLHVLGDVPLDATLTARFAVARAVSHANVARVHDLVPTPWGPTVIMEDLAGDTLATRIAAARVRGGIDVDKFRRVANDLYAALTAIHAQGLVHGDLDARSVMVTDRKAVIIDLGFRGPAPVPDLDPTVVQRRLADDVRRAALVCWDMWSRVAPGPWSEPRSGSLRSHALSELPSRLSAGELRTIFDALSEDPRQRPRARDVRFLESAAKTPSTMRPLHTLSPGPPPGSAITTFLPGAQGLLVTFAQTAPESVGYLLPLDRPVLTIGRSNEADLAVAEKTVSFLHARLAWQRGSWLVEDLGSTNGTYTEDGYGRQTRTLLRHGQEIQLGEMRLMLVNFADGSPGHFAARRWLARRDPLTGLLNAEWLARGLEDDALFADWADLPMVQATFRVEPHVGKREERLAILELLALRRVARRVVELTDNLLLSTRPVVAGRAVGDGRTPGRVDSFVVSIVAAGEEHVRNVIDLVLTDARHLLPPGFSLTVNVQVRATGAPIPAHPGREAAKGGSRRAKTWRS